MRCKVVYSCLNLFLCPACTIFAGIKPPRTPYRPAGAIHTGPPTFPVRKKPYTMFENLTDKLERSFKILKGEGRITEINIAETLKEIRRALIDADVN